MLGSPGAAATLYDSRRMSQRAERLFQTQQQREDETLTLEEHAAEERRHAIADNQVRLDRELWKESLPAGGRPAAGILEDMPAWMSPKPATGPGHGSSSSRLLSRPFTDGVSGTRKVPAGLKKELLGSEASPNMGGHGLADVSVPVAEAESRAAGAADGPTVVPPLKLSLEPFAVSRLTPTRTQTQ